MKMATQACHPCGSDLRLARNWKACCFRAGSAWGCHAIEMAFSIYRYTMSGQFGSLPLWRGWLKGTRTRVAGRGSRDLQRNLVMAYLALHFDGSSVKESRLWRKCL